jgi:GT2 family glycosyltransferase
VVRLQTQSGPAAARNAGIEATSAPLIAFTDADCTPAPGWLDALTAALEDHDLVQGPVLPARPPGPFDRTVSLPSPSPRFETANLAVRREVAERAGAFERLPFVAEGHFGEDVLFGWRAVRAGARRGWAPDAVVRHAVFPRGPRGYIAEQARLRYFPHLVREVPEMRDGVFLTPRTAAFDLAVAGLALAAATRRAWPLLATVPYARRRAYQPARLWRRSVLRINLALVAGDAVGLAALVRGSVQARRVVL